MLQSKHFHTLLIISLVLAFAGCARHQVNDSNSNSQSGEGVSLITSAQAASPVPESNPAMDSDPDELDLAGLEEGYAEPATADWKERSFLGNTLYSFENINGKAVIKGEAQGKASLLYRQQSIDLDESPWMSWRWKISNTYGDLNEKMQKGDDFPARVYVVVQTGLLPWESVAINYVWSSNASIGDAWDNPFTDKAKMVVLRSGSKQVGNWLSERRNVAQDFKTYFDMDISKLSGYAVMVDGDNSGNHGTAWFSEIRFGAG